MNRDEATRRRAGAVERLRQLVGATKVYALVGKSGTGKSFRAKLVAEKYGVEYIIDDGLLIQGNSIVAGKSAKREEIYMSAVRTALFDDERHRREVSDAIRSKKVRKILLLGTSERMVARTADRLELPPPSRVILIEEVSSEDDIMKAQKSRDEEGKHVIPVPSIEVERDYPHLLSTSIRVLFKLGRGFGQRRSGHHKVFEKSVVQPSFHGEGSGRLAISEHALGQMIAHCADEQDGELIVRKVKIRPGNGVYYIRANIEVPYRDQLPESLQELRNYIVNRIEKFTGIIIAEFDWVIGRMSETKRNLVSREHETPEIQD